MFAYLSGATHGLLIKVKDLTLDKPPHHTRSYKEKERCSYVVSKMNGVHEVRSDTDRRPLH